ncbi:uncharacterized protein LOC129457282 [Periophthalmus magnuspinnatus]|uniref:uncharacterized protein LOC129457282 n=1 Tax=Periophthalmus magnuspinnatus TaxID=409849 RepID=UPI002436A8E8|nr:uncharacterized protein LOC129457282 [Periophthalmus magnuspinnatus]
MVQKQGVGNGGRDRMDSTGRVELGLRQESGTGSKESVKYESVILADIQEYSDSCDSPGLGLDWAWTGPGLGLDWAWTGPGLGLDWAWTGPGLGLDWAWTGPGLGLVWAWTGPGVELVCSDLLNRPVISLSVSDGASQARPQGVRVLLGSKFRVKCSVEPQYPGGSFQLLSPTAPLGQNHTLPAVNHSAHFLFSDTGSAHKGNYTCVYHLHVFNHNFSSQSPSLQLSLGAPDSDLIIRVLLILLLKLLYILPMFYYYCKVLDL